MPRRVGGPRRRGANTEWQELLADDGFTLWLLEAEAFHATPFLDREELMESYPSWRAEYLEFCQRRHEAQEPQPPHHPDPLAREHLEASYWMQYQVWASQQYEIPPLERRCKERLSRRRTGGQDGDYFTRGN